MSRPEYTTCIRQTYDVFLSWCGLHLSLAFAFQNIDHAKNAVASGSRLTICPECWTAIIDRLDQACDLIVDKKREGRDMEHEPDVNAAIAKAVAAIYFDDNNDYSTALWGIVKALGGDELATLLKEDDTAVYKQYRKWL